MKSHERRVHRLSRWVEGKQPEPGGQRRVVGFHLELVGEHCLAGSERQHPELLSLAREPLVETRLGEVEPFQEVTPVDGRRADATQIVQDGLAAARQRGERGVEGHLQRLLGDIAANPDRVETGTAEARYRQALALAEELGLRPLAAHCHLGFAKLYRRMCKQQEAQEHLITATTMYREMEMPF